VTAFRCFQFSNYTFVV